MAKKVICERSHMGDPDYQCTGSQHPCIRSAGPGTKQPVTKMSEYISFELAGIDYTGLNQDGISVPVTYI